MKASLPRQPSSRLSTLLRAWILLVVCALASHAAAQNPPAKPAPAKPAPAKPAAAKPAPAKPPPAAPDGEPDDSGDDGQVKTGAPPSPPPPVRSVPTTGAQRVIKLETGQPQGKGELEIFPNAKQVYMHVYGTDPNPIEAARADRPGSWVCRGAAKCDVTPPQQDLEGVGDRILLSIGLSTSTSPLPIPVWTRGEGGDGVLLFNPILLGRASYDTVRVFPPVPDAQPAAPPPAPRSSGALPAGPPPSGAPLPPASSAQPGGMPVRAAGATPNPYGSGAAPSASPPRPMPRPSSMHDATDQSTLALSMRWPRETDAAEFRYLAIQDSCGNARVQPFQRMFSVPVVEIAEDSCPPPDGKVLRVFPRGGYFRVTAFNLKPERSDIVSVTYRVSIPPLDSGLDPAGAFLLFPDLSKEDLRIDCSVGGSDATPPKAAPPAAAPGAMTAPPSPGAGRKGFALAEQTFVIAPEPLMMGNCRLMLTGPNKGRLQAPLALWVTIERMDKGTPEPLLQREWVVTQRSSTFSIPPMRGDNFEPESRLRIRISSDPFSTNGKVMLLADASRVWPAVRLRPASNTGEFRREITAATLISAPLCGGWNVETTEKAGNCLRVYVTMPILLASFQVTRAPWKETAIAEPRIPAGIGLALAFDSYNPVKQRPFPLAMQLGGLYQKLSENKTGLMAYVGVTPSLPILGKGGATTSLGIMVAGGATYVMDSHGPNEGFKPAAFVSLVLGAGEFTFGGSSSASVSAGASAGTQ